MQQNLTKIKEGRKDMRPEETLELLDEGHHRAASLEVIHRHRLNKQQNHFHRRFKALITLAAIQAVMMLMILAWLPTVDTIVKINQDTLCDKEKNRG